MACELTNFNIPEPVLADIDIPRFPDIPTPAPPSLSYTKNPTLNDDLAGPILNFEYREYASILEDLIGGKIDTFFEFNPPSIVRDLKASLEKVKDDMAMSFRLERDKLNSNLGAQGFYEPTGIANFLFAENELQFQWKLYQKFLELLARELKIGAVYIKWAFKAGITETKIAFDEKRNIVYANLKAVLEVGKTLLDQEQKQKQAFDVKVKEYQSMLGVIEDYWKKNVLDETSKRYQLEAQLLSMEDLTSRIDKQYVHGLYVLLKNSCVLLQAKEIIVNAGLEKMKALQGKIILDGYLLKIKQAHIKLMQDRAKVKEKTVELKRFLKKLELLREGLRLVAVEVEEELDRIDFEYRKRIALLRRYHSNMQAQFRARSVDEEEYRTRLDKYRADVDRDAQDIAKALGIDIIKMREDLYGQILHFRESLEKYAKDIDITRSKFSAFLAGKDDVTRTTIQTCQKLKDAWADAKADTCMRLMHEIGSE